MAVHNNIESTHDDELIDAHAHVWNHIFNFINSMSLKCALQLGIPDIIHKHANPMTLSELLHALRINKQKSHGLLRLMRILTHSKFFIMVKISENGNNEDAYCLTPASRLLLSDGPFSVAPFALSMLDPMLIDPWHHVSEWFRNDCSTSFEIKHGVPLFDYLGKDEGANKLFNEGMASDARLVANVLRRECKQVFEGLKSMVDVGGGTGMLAEGIADAFPELKCTVFDLPHVVAGMEGTDSKNLSFVSGDMFDSIPPADAVFLKWILHDWNDRECVIILKKCKEAIVESKNNGGKVIILEMIVDDDDRKGKKVHEDEVRIETKLFFDLLMMINMTGKERTEKEWADLFFEAGFSTYKITPVLGLRSIIEVFP